MSISMSPYSEHLALNLFPMNSFLITISPYSEPLCIVNKNRSLLQIVFTIWRVHRILFISHFLQIQSFIISLELKSAFLQQSKLNYTPIRVSTVNSVRIKRGCPGEGLGGA